MAVLCLCECTLLTWTVLLIGATCQGFASLQLQVAGQSFLASQTENGITLSSTIIIPSGTMTTVTTTFTNEQFPFQCGVDPSRSNNIGRPSSTRCGVSVIRDPSTSRVAALVSTVNGAAITVFDDQPSLTLIDQYMIPLPPMLDCNLTSFVNLPDKLLGVCYGSTTSGLDETSVQVLSVVVNFDQLNQSTLEQYSQNNMITLSSTEFSNVFYLPDCIGSEQYIYWFDDGFLFDFRTDVTSADEQRYDTDSELSVCFANGLRRVIPFRENFLIAYCSSNTIIELDVCNRGGGIVPFGDPLPARFYCSGSENTYLQQGVENLSVVSSVYQSSSIPFPLDPSLRYTADCVDINGMLFFVGSSADGAIVLTDVLNNSTTNLATDATVPHQVIQNRYILYSNATSSTLLDLTCPLPASPVQMFNDSFHLANFAPNDNFSCNTIQPVEPTTTITITSTEAIMNLTTSELGPTIVTTMVELIKTLTVNVSMTEVTPTASVAINGTTPGGLNGGGIAGVIVGVLLLLVGVILGIVLVGVVIKYVKGKKKRRYDAITEERGEMASGRQPTQELELQGVTETIDVSSAPRSTADSDDGNNPPSPSSSATKVVSLEINPEDETAFASLSLYPPQVSHYPVADSETPPPESTPHSVQPLLSDTEAASRVPSPPLPPPPVTSPPTDSEQADPHPNSTPQAVRLPTGTVEEETPKLCLIETCVAQEGENDSRHSAQVAGSSTSARTMPLLTTNESKTENVSPHSVEPKSSPTFEGKKLVTAVSARPDNNDNVSMVTPKLPKLATNKSDTTWSPNPNGDIRVSQRYMPGNNTHGSTNGNTRVSQGATPQPIPFQNGPSPSHHEVTEYPAQEAKPVQASTDRTRHGPESQHSTVTGTPKPVPSSNFHAKDHEQVFSERQLDSERAMYIAGKIEGVEPSVQSQGASVNVNNGDDVEEHTTKNDRSTPDSNQNSPSEVDSNDLDSHNSY